MKISRNNNEKQTKKNNEKQNINFKKIKEIKCVCVYIYIYKHLNPLQRQQKTFSKELKI